jgi:hypothetical protein
VSLSLCCISSSSCNVEMEIYPANSVLMPDPTRHPEIQESSVHDLCALCRALPLNELIVARSKGGPSYCLNLSKLDQQILDSDASAPCGLLRFVVDLNRSNGVERASFKLTRGTNYTTCFPYGFSLCTELGRLPICQCMAQIPWRHTFGAGTSSI